MHPRDPSPAAIKQQQARERRLQTGAALVLGFVVLLAIVLRAGLRNLFPHGWWRF